MRYFSTLNDMVTVKKRKKVVTNGIEGRIDKEVLKEDLDLAMGNTFDNRSREVAIFRLRLY